MTSANSAHFIDEKVGCLVDENDLNNLYTNWSKTYDEDMKKEDCYKGYYIASKAVDLFSFGNKRKRILDIGAGTGLVAIELHKMGYENIDALEPNESMIKIAKEKNLYINYYDEFIRPSESLKVIEKDAYDHVTVAGCFTKGHMNYKHITRLLEPVKPGGYLSIVFRYVYIEDHQKEVIPEISRYEKEDKLKIMIMTEIPDYYKGISGILIVLKKL